MACLHETNEYAPTFSDADPSAPRPHVGELADTRPGGHRDGMDVGMAIGRALGDRKPRPQKGKQLGFMAEKRRAVWPR